MKKRNPLLIFGFIVLIILFLGLYFNKPGVKESEYFPEPPRPSGVPTDAKWNSKTGEWVNSDFEIDPITGQVFDPEVMQGNPEEAPKGIYDPKEKWLKEHKNSKNVIDQSLIKYNTVSNNQEIYNPKSFYDPKDDKALKILISLDMKYLPEILKRVEYDEIWAGKYMTMIIEKTKIKNIGLISVSPEGRRKWLNSLKDRLKKVNSIVKSNSNKLQSKDAKEAEKAKTEILDQGLFAIPFVMDEIKKGNDKILSVLPDLVAIYEKNSPDKFRDKTKEEWKEWYNKHSDELEVLRKMAS